MVELRQEPLASTSKVARNTVINLVGNVLPLLVGVFAIPYVVRGLGVERFGILSLAWVTLGYFTLFDVGLGRATTKYVAECLGRGDLARLPRLVWTSISLQTLLGATGALLAAALTPLLVEKVFRISSGLVNEARISFIILAAALPALLVNSSLRGMLEAAQRFDLVNYIKVPISVSVFVIPAIAVPFGFHLPAIISLLVCIRLCETGLYLLFCFKNFPVLKHINSFDYTLLRTLATYGGWITVSNLVGPVMIYMDRFLIGALLSMEAVGYYTVPYEAVTKLWILPGSLSVTLFPAISSLDRVAFKAELEELYARSIKSLLLLLAPVILLIVVFAHQILQIWMGKNFAETSTRVLQILALGVLINSLGFIPFTLLQALGRPDIVARFHLLELPIYLGLLWFGVRRMGISGAALAWTLRVCMDAVLTFGMVFRLKLARSSPVAKTGLLRAIWTVLAFGAVLTFLTLTTQEFSIQILFAAFILPLFFFGSWSFVLDEHDRTLITSMFGRFASVLGNAK